MSGGATERELRQQEAGFCSLAPEAVKTRNPGELSQGQREANRMQDTRPDMQFRPQLCNTDQEARS